MTNDQIMIIWQINRDELFVDSVQFSFDVTHLLLILLQQRGSIVVFPDRGECFLRIFETVLHASKFACFLAAACACSGAAVIDLFLDMDNCGWEVIFMFIQHFTFLLQVAKTFFKEVDYLIVDRSKVLVQTLCLGDESLGLVSSTWGIRSSFYRLQGVYHTSNGVLDDTPFLSTSDWIECKLLQQTT